MSLPVISTPKYSLVLPSTGKTISYRPFLVKEEKVLLIAQESDNQGQIINAIKDVIYACTFGAVEPNKLASYDLEYIFLKLRAKSVGENASIGLKCKECETVNYIDVNLDELELTKNKDISSRVMLTDDVGVNLKHISVDSMTQIAARKNANVADTMIDTVIACIDSIFDSSQIYPAENSTRAELEAFVQSLNRSQMQKIEEYIASAPKIEHVATFKCSKCTCENSTLLSGIQSFFG